MQATDLSRPHSSPQARIATPHAAMALVCAVAAGVALLGDRGENGLRSRLIDAVVAATARPVEPGLHPVLAWEPSFAAFAAQDQASPPSPGGTVFTGSSSIVMWTGLAQQFPHAQALGRGFGGSQLADCARHVDRLVLPYKPRQVVLYAGENDLAAGATPQQVFASYRSFVDQVHAAQPGTRVIFISIKPSPSRARLIPAMRQANALIAAHVRTDPTLAYVDVFSAMLDGAGRPRADIFLPDALHMNPAGYDLWNRAVRLHLR